MFNFKKILLILGFIFFIPIALLAKELKIVTSFYPMYIMAKNVAGNIPDVTVQNLTPPTTGCLHDYSLSPNDMKKLVDADIFIGNGAGMETFLDKIFAQYPHIKLIQLSDGIPFIQDNPHVWVSISNTIIQVQNLKKALIMIDPKHKKNYSDNADSYIAKLEVLKQKMHRELAPYKGSAIITFHEAFPYFAREFNLKIAAVIEREPGSEPNAKDLANTIKLIKKYHIKALFSEPQYPALSAQTIAKETGLTVYMLDPAVTGADDYDMYLRIMEKNLRVLVKALQ